MERVIPEFMQKYFEQADEEGHEHLKLLASHFEDDKRTFYEKVLIKQQMFQKDWNRLTSQRRQLNDEQEIQPLVRHYEEKAKAIAKEYPKHVDDEQQSMTISAKNPQLEEKIKREQKRQQFLENLKSIRERNAQHKNIHR